ncbi:MAG: glycosyltransferase [candidate division WOR-3 bacterium]|nr:glycosyltransferase [candidate division WOR-3 bacterium]MCX7757820.1 glycosyltransferase [candidate division WOR-3 bacterium]MDW7987097.1 glycosyltransferase [candidate division WOR-3 bacterium]
MNGNLSKKVLWLLYASHKGGHTYPTRALLNHLQIYYSDYFDSYAINILDYTYLVSFFETIGRYGDLKFRKLWRAGYKNLQRENKLFLDVWKRIEKFIFYLDNVPNKLLKKYPSPDLIISFQPELNAVADFFKKYFFVPWHTVIIDLNLHGLWVNNAVDFYYVYNNEMRENLIRKGFKPEQIIISGIPLREQFLAVTAKPQIETRKKLSLYQELPTILIMAGLLGTMVDFTKVIAQIVDLNKACQLLVVCGKNIRAQKEILDYKSKLKIPIYVYGTVDLIAPLMWSSDFIISKPGSVTIAEALALGKPMIVVTPKAGSLQEFYFAELLEKENTGRWANTDEEILRLVEEFLTNPELLENLGKNARQKHGHNLNATKIIAENIINIFQKRKEQK